MKVRDSSYMRKEYPPASRRDIFVFLATGCWVGFSPFAPGTVGALWGVPLAWSIQQLPSLWMQVVVIVAICALGVPLCTVAVQRLGAAKDPGCIVFDEIASLPITFFLVPLDSLSVAITGFALHRLIDITKPPPARQLEHLPDGWGVMADDYMAGIYSCMLLHLVMAAGVLPTF